MGNLPPRAASPWSVATDPTRTRGHLCPLHIPGCVPVGSAGAALGLRREGRPVWDLSTAPATGAVDAGAVLSLPQRQVAHGHSAPGQGARYGAQHAGSEDAVPTALHLPFTAPPGCVGPPHAPSLAGSDGHSLKWRGILKTPMKFLYTHLLPMDSSLLPHSDGVQAGS